MTPSTNEWLVMPPPTSHGVERTATLMYDGRVLVVGGAIGGGQQTDLVDIFDPQTNSWYAALPLASDRASHTAMTFKRWTSFQSSAVDRLRVFLQGVNAPLHRSSAGYLDSNSTDGHPAR